MSIDPQEFWQQNERDEARAAKRRMSLDLKETDKQIQVCLFSAREKPERLERVKALRHDRNELRKAMRLR